MTAIWNARCSNPISTERMDLDMKRQEVSAPIGIGRSLAAPPSHTTLRTGPYRAVRLVRQNRMHTRLLFLFCWAFGKHMTLWAFQQLLQCAHKYTAPTHLSHLPLPFGRRHRLGLWRGETSALGCGSLPIPSARVLRELPRLVCPLLTPVTRSAPLAVRSVL